MGTYRYKQTEIEGMKRRILSHCKSEREPDENGNKSAWRLRLVISMESCVTRSKKRLYRMERDLELYERLTKNNLPAWGVRMKSKKDLTEQIQRIYSRFESHRLYNKALSLTLFYNQNMSDTKENNRLHKLYMECRNYGQKERLLEQMQETKYPCFVYAHA